MRCHQSCCNSTSTLQLIKTSLDGWSTSFSKLYYKISLIVEIITSPVVVHLFPNFYFNCWWFWFCKKTLIPFNLWSSLYNRKVIKMGFWIGLQCTCRLLQNLCWHEKEMSVFLQIVVRGFVFFFCCRIILASKKEWEFIRSQWRPQQHHWHDDYYSYIRTIKEIELPIRKPSKNWKAFSCSRRFLGLVDFRLLHSNKGCPWEAEHNCQQSQLFL